MMKRLFGASVAAALAISLAGGAALAAPPNNQVDYHLNAEAHFNLQGQEVGLHLDGGDPDGLPPEVLDLWFHFDGPYNCEVYTNTNGAAEYSDDGSELTVNFEDLQSDCSDLWTTLQITFYLDTSRHRSHTNETGQQCRSTSQRDNSADVGVTLEVDGQGTIVDGRASNVGWYDSGKTRCHSTGTPGNPNK